MAIDVYVPSSPVEYVSSIYSVCVCVCVAISRPIVTVVISYCGLWGECLLTCIGDFFLHTVLYAECNSANEGVWRVHTNTTTPHMPFVHVCYMVHQDLSNIFYKLAT